MIATLTSAVIFIVSSSVFIAHLSTEDYVSASQVTKPFESVWINNEGCKCRHTQSDDHHFQLCEHCPNKTKTDFTLPSKGKGTCQVNDQIYFENETWMSSVIPCSKCRCVANGKWSCFRDKHCTNTCQVGQIPKYGPCCEVEKCLGKATSVHQNPACLNKISKDKVSHGAISIIRGKCIDNFCICYNGNWICHNYCEPSQEPLFYWNKLCCPRSTGMMRGNDSCNYENQRIPEGSRVYVGENNQNCSCLKGQVVCDKYMTKQKEGFVVGMWPSIRSNDYNKVILITLLTFIGVIICLLIGVIIISNVCGPKNVSRINVENDARMTLINKDQNHNYKNLSPQEESV